jgi:hypothetical protein
MPLQTLLTTKGLVHTVGGLNWGANAANHTRILDAYIPVHARTINTNIGLIPSKAAMQNIVVTWDDGTVMNCLFEGTYVNRATGVIYPKQISSAPHKNILGIYLRGRLGVVGNRPIVMNDLTAYGRTNVNIIYHGGNQYSIDFS